MKKKRKLHFSFVNKTLLLVLTCVTISLMILVWITSSSYYALVTQQVRSASEQQAGFLAQYLDYSFDLLSDHLSALPQQQDVTGLFKDGVMTAERELALRETLRRFCRQQPNITNAYVFSVSGDRMYNAYDELVDQPSYEDVIDSEWFRDTSRISSFMTRDYPFAVSKSIVSVCTVRNPVNKSLLGLCMVKISKRIFREVFNISEYPYGARYCVSDGGLVFYQTGELAGQAPDLQAVMQANVPASAFQQFGANVVLRVPVGNSNLSIVSAFPADLSQVAPMSAFYDSLLLCGGCVLVALFLSLMLTRRMIQPVQNLAHAMQHSTLGRLECIPVSGHDDEIGILEEKYNEMINRINEMIDREYRTTIALQQAQYKALQMQINPHFFNNTLQSIGYIAVERDMMDVYNLLRAFSQMFYYCLKFKGDIVNLEDEITYLRNYILIQEARFPGKFTFEMDIDDATLPLSLPKMTVQPLVENCFSHSFANMKDGWRIKVQARVGEDEWWIAIEDNGCGMTPDELQALRLRLDDERASTAFNASNIGLQNVNARIRMSYGAPYGLTIETEPGAGLKAILHLPTTKRRITNAQAADRR